MSISRETFDPAKNYKRVRYHQDRDLLDSELNEQQDIINHERKKIADMLFKEGAVSAGSESRSPTTCLPWPRASSTSRDTSKRSPERC